MPKMWFHLDSFVKNQNGGYLFLKCYTVYFYFMSSEYLPKYILKLKCSPLALTSCKAFSRNKEWCGTSFLASFSA